MGETLQHLKDRILAAGGGAVCRVILFGSRARGNARSDSDYDVLVLVRGIEEAEQRVLQSTLYRAVEGLGASIELSVMSEEGFEENKTVIGGLAYPAWKEGIVLHSNFDA